MVLQYVETINTVTDDFVPLYCGSVFADLTKLSYD